MIKKIILFSFILSYYFNSNAQVNKTDNLDSYAWIHYIDTNHFPINKEVLIKGTFHSIVNGKENWRDTIINLKFDYTTIRSSIENFLQNNEECSPFIVFDGIPVDNDKNHNKFLKKIKKSSLDKIIVIGFRTSLLLYGSRASCGVIDIRTKKFRRE